MNHYPENDEQQSWIEKLTELLIRAPKDKKQLTQLLRDAEHRNLINQDDLFMLEGVLNVSNETVKNIMIKREDMTSINLNDPQDKVIDILVDSKHSRIPCFNANNSEIVGILHAKDVLPFLSGKISELNVQNILRPASFVPDVKRLDLLLKEFKNSRNHMAIVLDEYGMVVGLATIEDVIEQIVGDIIDEFETK